MRSESRFRIANENRAIAHLWRNHFILGEQRALAKSRFAQFGTGIATSRAGGLAIEIGGIVITAAINVLSRKSGK